MVKMNNLVSFSIRIRIQSHNIEKRSKKANLIQSAPAIRQQYKLSIRISFDSNSTAVSRQTYHPFGTSYLKSTIFQRSFQK